MREFESKTKESVLQSVPEKWRKQYCLGSGKWKPSPLGGCRLEVYRKLLDCLSNGGTAEEVNTIIGNDSWTTLYCDLCRSKVDKVVCFGEDYESYNEVCSSCLEAMSKVFNEAT